MLDEITNIMFDNLGIIIIVAIIVLIIWICLYIVEYTDWFKFKKKEVKAKPMHYDSNFINYLKEETQFLIDNFDRVDTFTLLYEMNMITKYYLATIKEFKLVQSDTVEEIASKVKDKDNFSKLVIELLTRLEIMKHKADVLSKDKLMSYLKFVDAMLNKDLSNFYKEKAKQEQDKQQSITKV